MTSTSLNQVLGTAIGAAAAEGLSHSTKNALLLSFTFLSKLLFLLLFLTLVISFVVRKLVLAKSKSK